MDPNDKSTDAAPQPPEKPPAVGPNSVLPLPPEPVGAAVPDGPVVADEAGSEPPRPRHRQRWLFANMKRPEVLIALATLAVAAVGTLGGAVATGWISLELEQHTFERTLIQNALELPLQGDRVARLAFLSESGIVTRLKANQILFRGEQTGARPADAQPLVVDITVNGVPDLVAMVDGRDFSYSWSSKGATACTMVSPTGPSGSSLAGSGSSITTGHPWYPAPGSYVALVFACTDGVRTGMDVAVVGRLPQSSSR